TSNCKNLFSRSMVKAIPALSKMASRARYRTPMNSGPLTRETMVQNWSADGAISRRRTSTSSIVRAPQQRKLGKRQRRRHPAPPQEPAGGNGSLGRSHRSCQTISHSQVVMEPPTESFPHKEEKNACRSRIAYCADDGEGRAGRRDAGGGAAADRRGPGGAASGLETLPGAGRRVESDGSA